MWLVLASAALAADLRGMTISAEGWGSEWGTDAMAGSLDQLRDLGVNWVSFHPYARVAVDGTVTWRPFDPDHPPEWLARPIREAHARGMKVMVTPHLACWGVFPWRGAVAFTDPEAWSRFFATYGRFLEELGRATHEADALVVGSELDGTIRHELAWRQMIGAIRQVFPGPMTYAANWDRYADVPFWDALDVVGVQAYFPISTDPTPTPAALDAGWDQVNAQLHAFSARVHKHIVFTELGYDAGLGAAARPWENGDDGVRGEGLQRDCTRAALRAIDREEAVIGAFLWKWFPGETTEGGFQMSRPDLRDVIRQIWRAP